jgi:polysaccharide biosynthesis protein PslG
MNYRPVLFLTLVALILSLPAAGRASDFTLGVGTHVFGQDPARNMRALKKSGATSFRDDLLWDFVETHKGSLVIPPVLDSYLSLGAKQQTDALLILDYGNKFYDNGAKPVFGSSLAAYRRYAKFSSSRLAGKAKTFEIWNEWNHKDPKTPEAYFAFVKAVVPGIRAVNKDAILLAGAANEKGWIEALVALGVLNYVDGISIHPYIQCEPDKSPEAWLRFVADLSNRARGANGGKAVPLYITEMGWPSNTGACGTAPEMVAQYLGRALLLVRTLPEVKGFWWYDLLNDGKLADEMEQNFGLLTIDYLEKPAFVAYQDVAPFVLKTKSAARLPAPAGIQAILLTDDAGNKSCALWSDGGKRNASITMTARQGAATTLVKIGHSNQDQGVRSLAGSRFILPLDGTAQIITGIESIRISAPN